MKTTEIYLYGARDANTGKLVSDITNPKRKYWDRKGNAEKAIEHYNRYYANKKLKSWDNKGEHGTVELVTFKLVEQFGCDVLDTNDGEWIKKGLSTIVCSACEYIAWDYHTTPYCPNCGARMKEE